MGVANVAETEIEKALSAERSLYTAEAIALGLPDFPAPVGVIGSSKDVYYSGLFQPAQSS